MKECQVKIPGWVTRLVLPTSPAHSGAVRGVVWKCPDIQIAVHGAPYVGADVTRDCCQEGIHFLVFLRLRLPAWRLFSLPTRLPWLAGTRVLMLDVFLVIRRTRQEDTEELLLKYITRES